MKNKTLFKIVVGIIIVTLILVTGIWLSQSTEDTTGNLFTDNEIGVSFRYPTHWGETSGPTSTRFTPNFENLDGTDPATFLKEGILVYDIIYNAPKTIEELQKMDNEYHEKCIASIEEQGEDLNQFSQFCLQQDYSEWTQTKVNGHTVLTSSWQNVPASRSQVKHITVLLQEEGVNVHINALIESSMDKSLIEATWTQAFKTLKIN